MRRLLITASMAALVGCSSTNPVQILRIRDPSLPHDKGFILEADGGGYAIFETCSGRVSLLSIYSLTYEGDSPAVECASLAQDRGRIK